MMEKIKVEMATTYGFSDEEAFTTSVPGLVVCFDPFFENWTVTHLRSGLAVTVAPGPEEAMAMADKMGSLQVDWTQSGRTIRSQFINSRSEFESALEEVGVTFSIPSSGGSTTRGVRAEALDK